MVLITGIAVVLLAGFFQGLTSFGFALIAMPFLARIVPVKEAVPIVVSLSLLTNFLVLKDCYKHVALRKIWMLILASFVAAPIGAWLLLFVEPTYIKLGAGVLIVCFATLMILGKTFAVRNEKIAFIPVGFLSGLLNGSISLSGPPVALFLSNQGTNKNEFRANITFYAIFLNIVTIVSFALNGLLTRDMLMKTSVYVPGMAVGVLIGAFALTKLDERLFKKIALGLIIVSGLSTAIQAALALHA
jgi:uncharacterized membrane protein YfcA